MAKVVKDVVTEVGEVLEAPVKFFVSMVSGNCVVS